MFKGGNMNNLLKEAQKMQEKMQKAQEELAGKVVLASVGGGMVTVEFTGAQVMKSIKIDPEVVDKNDVGTLQDLVLAAVNEGLKKSQDLVQQEMGGITGGMKIPGLFG